MAKDSSSTNGLLRFCTSGGPATSVLAIGRRDLAIAYAKVARSVKE
jgi:hypothetical protein